MDLKNLDRANEIIREIDKINEALDIMRKPYPHFYEDAYGHDVSFASFSKDYIQELKTLIITSLEMQKRKLYEEVEEL